jgi:hypothetical protein
VSKVVPNFSYQVKVIVCGLWQQPTRARKVYSGGKRARWSERFEELIDRLLVNNEQAPEQLLELVAQVCGGHEGATAVSLAGQRRTECKNLVELRDGKFSTLHRYPPDACHDQP